ncbi:MAG: hypothetical protein Q9199_000564 [Rusavskia elegans]
MNFPIRLLLLLLPIVSKLGIANPISVSRNFDTTGIQSNESAGGIHAIQTRDNNDNLWYLVHYSAGSIIQPVDFGAAVMAEFYSLVRQAAMGNWRQREPARLQLHIAWHRVSMVMIAQGIEHIPWELVAEYAQGMLNWVNNGHVAFTYDGFFLRPTMTPFPHGLYVGVRIVGQQEGVNNYLAGGRHGVLDPSQP